jgi:hypothetical protein
VRSAFDSHFERHRVEPKELAKIYPTGPLFAWPMKVSGKKYAAAVVGAARPR